MKVLIFLLHWRKYDNQIQLVNFSRRHYFNGCNGDGNLTPFAEWHAVTSQIVVSERVLHYISLYKGNRLKTAFRVVYRENR